MTPVAWALSALIRSWTLRTVCTLSERHAAVEAERGGTGTSGVSDRGEAGPGVGRKRSVRLGSHIGRESLEQYLLHWARR